MLEHPELIDNMPILLKLKDDELPFISSHQESRLEFILTKGKNSEINRQESSDWGVGFYLQKDNQDAFFATNNFEGLGTELTNIANRIKGGIISGKTSDVHEDLSISTSIVDISTSGYWSNIYDEEAYYLINDIGSILSETPFHYNIRVEGDFVKKSFQSSEFLDIKQQYSTALVTIELVGNSTLGSIQRVAVFGGINKSNLDWKMIEDSIYQLIIEMKQMQNAKPIKAGNYPVVFAPDSAYSLAHETIGHGCEADQIVNNNSFLSGMQGFKVASSELTIIDDPHIRGMGWSAFDDEGIKVKGNILVDEGILTSLLHNKKTARLLGDEITGNARTVSYLSPPEPRQSNIYIEPRDNTFEELTELVKNGLYIGPTLSASTSIYTGEFSIVSQFGYEIKDGELSNMLGPMTATGQALNALNNIIGIGNEVEMIPTFCMKAESKLPIGAVSPAIALSSLNIH